MKRYVLDSSALMAFFQDEPGAAKVQDLLTRASQADRPLLMSAVNWGEVYYATWQRAGAAAARQKLVEMARLPLEIVAVDQETALLAATFKVRHRLHYADCFAAALAQQRKAALVASDRDFGQLQEELAVVWVKAL